MDDPEQSEEIRRGPFAAARMNGGNAGDAVEADDGADVSGDGPGRALDLPRPQADRLWLERLKGEGLVALGSQTPTLAAGFWQAVEEFNAGDYWRAHELLERIWLDTPYPMRLFYYALIKLAVGLLHLERHNAVGARRQLVVAAEFLEPFTPVFLGVATDALRDVALDRLRRLGGAASATSPEVDRETDRQLDPPVWVQGEPSTHQGSPSWEEVARLPAPRIEREAPSQP